MRLVDRGSCWERTTRRGLPTPALLDLRHSAAAFVAVAMSTAPIIFAFIVSDSVRTRVAESARASVDNADMVILADRRDDTAGDRISERVVRQVSAADGVASVRPYVEEGVLVDHQDAAQESSLLVLDVPMLTGSTRLVESRLPQADNRIVVSSTVLERQQNVKVGSTLTVKASEDTSSMTVNVVGVVRPRADVARYDAEGAPRILATGQTQAAMGLPDDPTVLYVTRKTGTGDKKLLSSVTKALATAQPGARACTTSEIVTMRTESSDGTASRTIILLQTVVPVCIVASGIVIATALTTLMARQTHQIGLLRCVDATHRQVMGPVLRTTLLIGLAGSVAGAVVGAVIAMPIIDSGLIEEVELRHLTISWTSFVLAVLVDIVVTMVSVLRPARQVSRVSALMTLTEQTAGHESLGRQRVATAVVGAVVAALGLGLIHDGVTWRVLEVIGAGTVVAVLGIIPALPLLVVRASCLVGSVCGQECRPILHLATCNLTRSPGRAVATTTSLLVAVAVTTAVSSGLSSVASSMQTHISYHTPVDITVGKLNAGQDLSSTIAKIAAVNDVEGVVPMLWLKVTMTGGRQKDQKKALTVSTVGTKTASPVLRPREALGALDNRILLLDRICDITDGTPVTLTRPAGSVSLTVRMKEGLDAAITPAIADRLVGNAPTAPLLWMRADGDGLNRAPISAVREAVMESGLSVGDSQEGRTNLTDQVRQVSIAIGAMLVFTLLITLSGLVNTVDVNILERTREIGALRATGTQRSGVGRLLIVEAVLTALLSSAIGILLGCGVGIAGAAALLTTDSAGFLTVPVPWLALILVGILLISAAVGVLASLRPTESTGRIPPVHILAQD